MSGYAWLNIPAFDVLDFQLYISVTCKNIYCVIFYTFIDMNWP